MLNMDDLKEFVKQICLHNKNYYFEYFKALNLSEKENN